VADLFQRARLAWKVLRHGLDRRQLFGQPAGRAKQANGLLMWPTFVEGKPQWQRVDYRELAESGFSLNSIIYSAIMYRARAITCAPLRAYGGETEKPEPLPAEHPLSRLVARPNRWQGWAEFDSLLRVYFNLSGNAYVWVKRDGGEMGVPAALIPLRPDRVYEVPKNKDLLGWLYVPEGRTPHDGVPIPPQDMIHVRLPNPLDPFEGMGAGLSPLAPLAKSGDVDNCLTSFLDTFFRQGAMPTGILKVADTVTEDDVARMRARWKELYGGVENWDEIVVLDNVTEYQRVSMTFEEMGFDGLDERNESRIVAPFGVPPILLGVRYGLKHATYSNYAQARQACWEDTLLPENKWFEDEYRYYLQSDDGGFVAYDYSNVPALQKNMPELIGAAAQLWDRGVPMNQALRIVGLNIEAIAGGDRGYLPISVLPVTSEKPASPVAELPEAEEQAEQASADWRQLLRKGWTPEQKAMHQKRVDQIAQSWEQAFAEAAEEAFEYDRRGLRAVLSKHKSLSLKEAKTVNWEIVNQDWQAWMREHSEPHWREKFLPLIKAIITEQGEAWAAALGMQWDVTNIWAMDWFKEYTLVFAKPINQTTTDTLSKLLNQAEGEGWTISKVEKRLDLIFRQWMKGDLSPEEFEWFAERLPLHRRELIARTETMRASNMGSHALFKSAGVQLKEWQATLDDRTRPSHLVAMEDYREGGRIGPIPLDSPFMVGGHAMMYPGDPSAPIEEFANCRCTTLPYIPPVGGEVQ